MCPQQFAGKPPIAQQLIFRVTCHVAGKFCKQNQNNLIAYSGSHPTSDAKHLQREIDVVIY
jgi:hypothetical protein